MLRAGVANQAVMMTPVNQAVSSSGAAFLDLAIIRTLALRRHLARELHFHRG